jgi:putative ABC transport system substrate-binding protein
MNRRTAIRQMATVILTSASFVQAQQAKKIPRIGYVSSQDPAGEFARAEGIRLALRERGYIEGQNIVIEYRYTERKPERRDALIAELVRLNVDVIVISGGSGFVRAAMNATRTIPIVMAGQGLDPVAAGFVKSLAQPGGNVTGFTNLGGYLAGKRLEIIKDAVPKVRRVAILHEANNARNMFEFKEVIPTAARELKLTILRREVRDENDFERVFAMINKDRPDGLHVLSGPLMNANRKRTIDFALKSRLPSVYDAREDVESGGLLYYGADATESYQRVAYFIDRLLKGAKPSELPVEQPMRFELWVNLITAEKIRVKVDPNLLARAQRIIS